MHLKIWWMILFLCGIALGEQVKIAYTEYAFGHYANGHYGKDEMPFVDEVDTIVATTLSKDEYAIGFFNKQYTLIDITSQYDVNNKGDSIFTVFGKEKISGSDYVVTYGPTYVNIVKVGVWKLSFGGATVVGDEVWPDLVFGSSFAVNPHTLVTNNHVVEKHNVFAVSNRPTTKKYVEAEVVYRDPDLDLAVLHTDSVLSPCRLDKTVYDIGEEIFVYGYPQVQSQGVSLKLTKGVISSKRGFKDDVKTYQIDAAVQHGNSGGPLVRKGKVVGVVSAMLLDSQNVNYAIKSNFVGAVLDVLGIRYAGNAAPKECTYFVIGANK